MHIEQFLATLSKLIGHSERLQNSVDAGKVPREALAAEVVTHRLAPYIQNGALIAKTIFAPNHPSRHNLLLTLPGQGPETLTFMGAHFDVVPADRVAEGWRTNPFELTVEPDGTLRGRGVTDCLGHVAVLTELLAELLEQRVVPKRTLHFVFIANEEESSVPGIGLDYLAAQGHLEAVTRGPVIWLDSADFGPTLGTGGIGAWELIAEGKPGHSGMPQNCINALELGMAAVFELESWFHKTYPPHPKEATWRYASSSSMKSTIIDVDNHKVTKIPGLAKIQGDIRMTPFYEIDGAVAGAVAQVEQMNERIRTGDSSDPMARFRTATGHVGRLEFLPKEHRTHGIACDLNSPLLGAMTTALEKIRGKDSVRPWSMTGSLPLVRDLQRAGVDIQISGFGKSVGYHAPNEFGTLQDFSDGYELLRSLVDTL